MSKAFASCAWEPFGCATALVATPRNKKGGELMHVGYFNVQVGALKKEIAELDAKMQEAEMLLKVGPS